MGFTGIIHHFGTFLLFVATILLIISSISAPVVHDIGLLKVRLSNTAAGTEVVFGSYGWCVKNAFGNGRDQCTNAVIGYDPMQILQEADGDINNVSSASANTAEGLTRVFVLHSVAAALAFIGFAMALGASFVGSFLASVVAFLTFLVTLVVVVCDFVAFALVAASVNNIRGRSFTDASATYSAGIWTALVAGICALLATIILFITCCSARIRKRREQRGKVDVDHHSGSPRRTNRRWWSRRRY